MSIQSLMLCLCKAESELLEFKMICFTSKVTDGQVPAAPDLLEAVQTLLEQCAKLKQEVENQVGAER